MSERGVVFALAVAVVIATRCGSSPTEPEISSRGEPVHLLPAAHLDCDSPDDLRARIEALEENGTLTSGRATALRNKIDQAERHAAAGRTDEAARAYASLIEQVEGWVRGRSLSEGDTDELLACAEDVADGPDVSFIDISAGAIHACGVTMTGEAYCWGENSLGQLGDGTLGTHHDTPVAVLGGLTFQTISAGSQHTCGVTVSGDAYCWGDNDFGELGDGNAPSISATPVAVSGGLSFESISAGVNFTCGVTTGGAAYCWGASGVGTLGDGNAGTDSDTPVAVSGGLTFKWVSAGSFHACGVTTSGDAYCWGSNDFGNLGDGNSGVSSDVPVAVSGGLSFESVSAGNHYSCGATTSGQGYCWGDNLVGQLGDGNAGTDSETPVAVAGVLLFQVIRAGGFHTCGVTMSGDAYCWGSNTFGRLGDGNAGMDSDTPVAVIGELVFESIDTGGFHTCGVTTSGDAYCWGDNEFGRLGDGNAPIDSDVPVPVASP